ncbi:MAG: 30S ribosomal protein S12 methylthiotransferase RimO [Clostridia bacterium]|nr:30S ribosomal protein S12 methylthiotransferase RimO [Clostridia bacterium]
MAETKIKVGFVSLGCEKNRVDTEVMLKKLIDAGMEIVPEDIDADVIVINTCGFIENAKKEAIENILDVAWLRENRGLRGIVVTGCLAQRYGEELFTELPEIDSLIGVGDLGSIVEAVKSAYEKGGKGEDRESKYCCITRAENQVLGEDRVITTPEYSAYIKISEGCDNKCTYCAIPMIRGRFRSRTMEDIVREAKELADMGATELIIISQDTTRYGLDLYGELKLPELLRELCKIEKLRWIRLLYCYPEETTDELIDVIASEEKIVKYIDMPIQHISDKILKLMNRRGDSALIKDRIKALRERVPGVIIRTTVIVGFPGEKGEDFATLAEFLKETKFDRLGVFTYSEEEGTPAANLPDKVSEKQMQRRCDSLMENQMAIHEKLNQRMIGQTLEVLCEGFDPVSETYYGRSKFDAPDIDGKVYFEKTRNVLEGEYVNIKIREVVEYDLIGDLI